MLVPNPGENVDPTFSNDWNGTCQNESDFRISIDDRRTPRPGLSEAVLRFKTMQKGNAHNLTTNCR